MVVASYLSNTKDRSSIADLVFGSRRPLQVPSAALRAILRLRSPNHIVIVRFICIRNLPGKQFLEETSKFEVVSEYQVRHGITYINNHPIRPYVRRPVMPLGSSIGFGSK